LGAFESGFAVASQFKLPKSVPISIRAAAAD
jgi:hypothetical protein